jgi:hypothetical protein
MCRIPTIYEAFEVDSCRPAIDWATSPPEGTSKQADYDRCENGGELLWLNGCLRWSEPWSDARKPIVLAACECVRLALPHAPKWNAISMVLIEAIEQWVSGQISRDTLQIVAYEVYRIHEVLTRVPIARGLDASDVFYFASRLTWAMVDAVSASHVGSYGRDICTKVAYAVGSAELARGVVDSETEACVQRACAAIVRKHFPTAPIWPPSERM